MGKSEKRFKKLLAKGLKTAMHWDEKHPAKCWVCTPKCGKRFPGYELITLALGIEVCPSCKVCIENPGIIQAATFEAVLANEEARAKARAEVDGVVLF